MMLACLPCLALESHATKKAVTAVDLIKVGARTARAHAPADVFLSHACNHDDHRVLIKKAGKHGRRLVKNLPTPQNTCYM